MAKPKNEIPNNVERQKLRDWLVAHGMSIGDAAQLTTLGKNREQQAIDITTHLHNGKKQKGK